MNITAKTKPLALFGYPAGHSLSPDMHNAAFEQMGLPYCYLAIEVKPEDLPDAVRAIRAFGIRGVNLTVPHKEKVIALLDEIDEEAAFMGAVNTIVNTGGRLKGYNTDGRGFMKMLDEEDVDVTGKDVFICGAGGGSRAISYYLSEKAKSLRIFNVNRGKLEKLVSDLGGIRDNVSASGGIKEAGEASLFINATPLGLKPEDPLPADPTLFSPKTIVGDLIYRETPLLREAKKRGLKTFNGLGMLLWQGVLASELWTGIHPPHETMRKALLEKI